MTVTLVLLPGMDGTGDLFQPLIAAVARKFSVRVVSYPDSKPLGYSELESVVRSALPTNEPFVILGESFSGPIAIAIAASHPAGLMGLVLCCSFARNPRPGLSSLSFLIDVLPTGPFFARGVGMVLLGRFATSALRQIFVQAVSKVAPETLRARLRSVLAVDVTGELAAVKVPILYLRGDADRVVPVEAAELVKSIQPETQLVDVKAPHFLLQVAPKRSAELIGEFVDAILRTSLPTPPASPGRPAADRGEAEIGGRDLKLQP